MKSRLPAALMFIAGVLLMLRCSKDNTPVSSNTMHAEVDLAKFSSGGNDVTVAFPLNPLDTTKTELVIVEATGNPDNLTFLLIQIFDFDKFNGSGTYLFDSTHATGLYSPGLGVEDFFVNGSVVIRYSDGKIAGTFSATTKSGIKVTNGDFSVEY